MARLCPFTPNSQLPLKCFQAWAAACGPIACHEAPVQLLDCPLCWAAAWPLLLACRAHWGHGRAHVSHSSPARLGATLKEECWAENLDSQPDSNPPGLCDQTPVIRTSCNFPDEMWASHYLPSGRMSVGHWTQSPVGTRWSFWPHTLSKWWLESWGRGTCGMYPWWLIVWVVWTLGMSCVRGDGRWSRKGN